MVRSFDVGRRRVGRRGRGIRPQNTNKIHYQNVHHAAGSSSKSTQTLHWSNVTNSLKQETVGLYPSILFLLPLNRTQW